MQNRSLAQTLLNKFIRYSSFIKIKQLLLKFKLFDYFYQINVVGMLSILVAREKLATTLDFLGAVLLHGLDHVKSQHRTLKYYHKWIKNNEQYNPRQVNNTLKNFHYKPLYSLIMVIEPHSANWLHQALDSICRQFYPQWELCLSVPDAGPAGLPAALAGWRAACGRRLNLITAQKDLAPAAARNGALKQARGEFIAFISPADTLAPQALYEVTRLLNAHPDAEFIYSDEDKIQEDSIRFDPFFKPDWSPDLCRSLMYTGNLAVYRRATLERLGGLRPAYGAAFAYDLVLRLMDHVPPARIHHLPRLLYHVRSTPDALNHLPADPAAHAPGKLALQDYCCRHNLPGAVTDGLVPGSFRLRRSCPGNPRVAIIIPFRDRVPLLKRCLDSLLAKTAYPNYEIILVNNRSREPETAAFLAELAAHPAIYLCAYDHDFNFAAINNFAAARTAADYLLFLNNDTEVIAPEWLTAMMEHIIRPEVGAVGAKLLYADHTIQHAGVVMGITRICGHAFRRLPGDHPGYFGQLQVVRNCSAVTGACMLVKKKLFQAMGGFDAAHLPVSYNDIDLCLRLRDAGYLIVWTPYALLYHQEYASRGDDRDLHRRSRQDYQRIIAELEFMEHTWGRYIDHDPYYHPNLTRLFEDYSF